MPELNAEAPDLEMHAMAELTLKEADHAALRFVVDKSKQAGNDAFKCKRYNEAIKMYTQAIAGDTNDCTLFGNRSAAYMASGLFEQALWDAEKAVELNPSWAKAYYRLGCAQMALNQWSLSINSLKKGFELNAESIELQDRLKEAKNRLATADAARRAAAATERRSLVLKLRAARKEDQKLAMMNQFKQSMAAPDWELDDLEWRPTWAPSMRLEPVTQWTLENDRHRAALLAYLMTLSDLTNPKAALRILHDSPRLQVYQKALHKVLESKPDAHVLALAAGGGVLALLATRAGAGRVTAVERSRMLYRMAKQILEDNSSEVPGVQQVYLMARSLTSLGIEGESLPPPSLKHHLSGVGKTGDVSSTVECLPSRANVLVTDIVDHAVLGMGLLPAVDWAAAYLLTPQATILPSRIQVRAVLIELCLGNVSGFDLSPLDANYRWYPGDERVDLTNLPHRTLSKPFLAHTLDLQARVDRVQRRAQVGGEGLREDGRDAESDGTWEADFEIEVEATATGKWNAVAFWFEMDLLSPHEADDKTSSSIVLASYSLPGARVDLGSDSTIIGASWGQAVQYIDSNNIAAGDIVRIRVRQDTGQIILTPHPPPCRLRHALAPRWHFDMVQDSLRNEAYDEAIRRAVALKRDMGNRHLTVLDIGAGSGLLSMMAARAGADDVYAAEISAHMCDVAEDTTLLNGFLGKILVLDRDVRRMDVVRKPDGTAPELPRPADLAVFEIFDSGLIGEGALHCLAAARARLLARDAGLVPMSATVYAQPIQMRLEHVVGLKVAQANRWRWRPDYEGIELTRCREDWMPLAEPLQVFNFDFYDVERFMRPEETALDFEVCADGVVNAVVMWFELHLDENTSLSTSPYCGKGPTWQQAIQWIPELRVKLGERLAVTGKHDTYSIRYEVSVDLNERSTGVPITDPIWKASHDALQEVNQQLVKACVQNPLEFRAAALAAVQFACRPHDVGLDAAHAAEFCVKMMGVAGPERLMTIGVAHSGMRLHLFTKAQRCTNAVASLACRSKNFSTVASRRPSSPVATSPGVRSRPAPGAFFPRAAAATAAPSKLSRDEVITKDPANNIPDNIFEKIGVNLHQQPGHPIGIIKDAIYSYFHNRHPGVFSTFDDLVPIVSATANFDEVLVPADHVSRSPNDTYYVNGNTVLRCHTSAHQAEMLRVGQTAFLVTGDVYRRDSIDATHYPVFHQMEGVRVFTEAEWTAAGAANGAAHAEVELKATLEGLARHLFGDVEMRWIDAYFPFTEPSFELEIFFKGQWLEVLGCGVMEQAILEANGRPEGRAWAFGLGLERLAMVLFDIPDIRLFWTADQRFLKQFRQGDLTAKFKSYSKFPPCYKDVAFWVSDQFTENNLCEVVRGVAGDLVEEVKLIDDFTHPKTGRTSNCFRIAYRSMDRSLTDEEINELQDEVRRQVSDKLKVELR